MGHGLGGKPRSCEVRIRQRSSTASGEGGSRGFAKEGTSRGPADPLQQQTVSHGPSERDGMWEAIAPGLRRSRKPQPRENSETSVKFGRLFATVCHCLPHANHRGARWGSARSDRCRRRSINDHWQSARQEATSRRVVGVIWMTKDDAGKSMYRVATSCDIPQLTIDIPRLTSLRYPTAMYTAPEAWGSISKIS